MAANPRVATAAQEFKEFQSRRAAAYTELHVMLRAQVSAVDDVEARALMHEGQQEAAQIQLEFQEVSKGVRGLEAELLEGDVAAVKLAKALRGVQNLEKRKLELTHAVYKTRATIKNFEAYNRREKDPWEAEDEYTGCDMEAGPSVMDAQALRLDAARRELNGVVEDINDALDVIDAMYEAAAPAPSVDEDSRRV